MKVQNMRSERRGGREVPNQFIITGAVVEIDGVQCIGELFQSYRTAIAFISYDGRVFLDRNSWDYSVTTGKYRNQFLGEGIAETRKKIKSGEYCLTALN